jgi:NAD-dependent SIR2 family protein deacetylase
MLEIKEVRHLVEDLQRARGDAALEDRGRAVFLIGAGCSRSAGIPLSREIAKDAATDLARMYSNEAFKSNDPDQALEWLKCNGKVNKEQLWDDLYGELFEAHYKDPREQQARIINAIERGDSAITPLLGELVRRCYVHTILTTNFDQLVLQGIVRTGILPVVADGIESLTRIDSRPRYPQVVYLHGSMHTYNLRNSRSAVADTALSKSLHRALYDLLRDSTVTVIAGYAGGEEGVMQLLTKAAAELPDKVMYWVSHGANPDDISPGAKKLLAQERNKFQSQAKMPTRSLLRSCVVSGLGRPPGLETRRAS